MVLKKLSIICLTVAVCIGLSVQVCAAATDTYSKADIPGGDTELRLSREMYSAVSTITAEKLGLNKRLEGITDIFVDDNKDIYILCGESSRLVAVDSDYKLIGEITVTDSDGNTVNYTGARGIYSDSNGRLYICDTNNERILVTDKTGRLKQEMKLAKSNLIPENFVYQPVAIDKDRNGYTYILSLGSYYGVLMYSPTNEFLGFYGANTVKASALDTLTYLWDKLFSNDEKKSNSVKMLPNSFSDFCFDPDGYMVTITGSTERFEFGKGQIRKISHNGADILFKRTLTGDAESTSSLNFLEKERDEVAYSSAQNLVAVDVSDDNYIFALDSTNGTVYIYDSECNLMSAFGGGTGVGEQLGVFRKPVSLALIGNSVLVADEDNCSVTVFQPTEYGNCLREAQSLYLKGNYDEAKNCWQKVLSYNRNCQLAYRGLAMAYYNEGEYQKAMDAAEIAVDYSVYDMARNEIISEYVSENFVWLLLIALAVVAVIVALIIVIKKKNIRIKNKKILLFLESPFHPFSSFDDLKYRSLGSYKIAFAVLAVFYIASVMNTVNSGFLYKTVLARNYNSLFTIAGTVGLVVLWSVGNWLVCSIFSGKGTFKEVFVSTAYALFPYVLFKCITVITSNVLPLSTAGLISGIETALLIYTFFLLSVAMMKVHEYDFFKFLLTGIVTVFFMILVVFVILMCVILIKQVGSYIYSVYEEIVFR